jgi:hypothetical protein
MFCTVLQNIVEEELALSEPVAKLLETSKGRQHLDSVVQKHSSCGVEIQNACVRCAALNKQHLNDFLKEFRGTFVTRIFKVCRVFNINSFL